MNQKIYKTEVATGWDVPWKSFELMKVNYGLALGTSFFALLCSLLQYIPIIGPLILGPLLVMMSVGTLFIARDWEQGKTSDFNVFLKNMTSSQNFNRVLVIIICSFVASGLSVLLTLSAGSSLIAMLLTVIISGVSAIIVQFGTPQLIFNDNIDPQTAIRLSFRAASKNLLPLFLSWITVGLLAIVSFICLILPFFLVFIPAVLAFNYVWYRVIFEGLDLSEDTPSTTSKSDLTASH